MENLEGNSDSYETNVHAVLSGLHFTPKQSVIKISNEEFRNYYNSQRDAIKKGFELIPNKLYIRYVKNEDIENIKSSMIFHMYGKIPYQNDVMVELFYKEGDSYPTFTYPIEMTLLALRLFKDEYVSIHKIAFFDKGNKGGGIEGDYEPLMGINSDYYLTPDDIPHLIEIINKLMKWDWSKTDSYELACSRFGKSYDEKPVDQIIDLYIGLESLFCKKEDWKKGKIIGRLCSELIGKSEADKTEIKEKLILGYNIRNAIVHGGISETSVVDEIHPFIEKYLRASLYKLIIEEDR